MECKTTKAIAVGMAVMLTAFLLPTSFGYADDQADAPVDSPDKALEPESGGEADAPSGNSDGEGILPEAGAQLPADDGLTEPIAEQLDSTDGPEVLIDETSTLEAGSGVDPEASALAEKDADPVQSYAGATMFETAVAEAKAAYPQGSESAIVVGPGDAWIDALSATGLAASKGPILFVERDSLHPATGQALKDLGVKSVVVIGGTAAVSSKAEQAIKAAGIKVEARLGGADCYDTQMKIYEYGKANGLWEGSLAVVATGSHFGDALSVSPVAFAKKAPVFLVESGGTLRSAQQQALVKGARDGGFTSVVLVGGPAAVSKRVEGFVSGMTYWNGGSYMRLAGATQYETSAEVAKWATSTQGFAWDNLAFSTGKAPYDALAGSVLQGGSKSVLLLADDANTATLSAAAQHKDAVSHVRFLGGTAAVPQKLRNTITSTLGISASARSKAASVLEERMDDAVATGEEGRASKDGASPEASADGARPIQDVSPASGADRGEDADGRDGADGSASPGSPEAPQAQDGAKSEVSR